MKQMAVLIQCYLYTTALNCPQFSDPYLKMKTFVSMKQANIKQQKLLNYSLTEKVNYFYQH